MTAEQELGQMIVGKFAIDETSRICQLVQQIKRDEWDRAIRVIRDTEAQVPLLLAKSSADFIHAKMIETLRAHEPYSTL